jgi:hypothetical protein
MRPSVKDRICEIDKEICAEEKLFKQRKEK